MHYTLDPHLIALIAGSEAICEMLELLPECDIKEELVILARIQSNIIETIAKGRHFGSDSLDSFISHAENATKEAIRIHDEN